MKKRIVAGKLQLSRETLQRLTPTHAAAAIGGADNTIIIIKTDEPAVTERGCHSSDPDLACIPA